MTAIQARSRTSRHDNGWRGRDGRRRSRRRRWLRGVDRHSRSRDGSRRHLARPAPSVRRGHHPADTLSSARRGRSEACKSTATSNRERSDRNRQTTEPPRGNITRVRCVANVRRVDAHLQIRLANGDEAPMSGSMRAVSAPRAGRLVKSPVDGDPHVRPTAVAIGHRGAATVGARDHLDDREPEARSA